MQLVRDLERRLERLVESAGRVFGGSTHPVEIAAQLLREADLSIRDTDLGPEAPNGYTVTMNPESVPETHEPLEAELATAVEITAAERGWRLPGPVFVRLETDEDTPLGTVECWAETRPGLPSVWCRLSDPARHIPVHFNRSLVGRSGECDVVISEPTVSRRHALIWREGGSGWLADLGSSNGTRIDGTRVEGITPLVEGSNISFGKASLRYETM